MLCVCVCVCVRMKYITTSAPAVELWDLNTETNQQKKKKLLSH